MSPTDLPEPLAPRRRSISTTPRWPLRWAASRAVPSSRWRASGSAPASISRRATSVRPLAAASISGVRPLAVAALTSAPSRTRASTRGASPRRAASSNARSRSVSAVTTVAAPRTRRRDKAGRTRQTYIELILAEKYGCFYPGSFNWASTSRSRKRYNWRPACPVGAGFNWASTSRSRKRPMLSRHFNTSTSLQLGLDLAVEETHGSPLFRSDATLPLQLGLDLAVEETPPRWRLQDGLLPASIGPRPRGRGNVHRRVGDVERVRVASIGPRPRGRGND